MRDPALRALLRLEVRRVAKHLRQLVPGTAFAAALLVLLAGGGSLGWGMGLGVAGFTFVMSPVARAVTDKLDGTLEFLTSLPVEAWRIALVQVASCFALAVIAAFPITFAMLVFAPGPAGGAPGLLWPAALWLVVSLCLGAATSFGAAVLVRFPVETAGSVPTLLFFGLLGLVMWVERTWPGTDAALVRMVASPNVPILVVAVAGLVALSLLALAWLLLLDGYRRFRPTTIPLPAPLRPFPS